MAAVLEIIQEVLNLPRTDRSYLVKKLIESLEADDSFTVEEMETFHRRSREVREASVMPLTLEQLEQGVNARFA